MNLVGIPRRQRIHSDNLGREVVGAPALERFGDDDPGRRIEIVGVLLHVVGDETGRRIFIDAIRRQQKDVALLQRHGLIVDVQLRIHAQRAA